jgi:acetylornithine deacetylase/succinyl-diaminopimelate desuccinylase family protein
MDLRRALEEELENRKGAILALARDLIRIPTENPPGVRYRECAERLRLELEKLGLPPEIIEAPGFPEHPRFNLLSVHGGQGPVVYFHGHYDVVPAQDPGQFVPQERNGRLIGRGAADMKPALASMIYAVALLKRLAVPLKGRIGICLVADEETGGQGGSGYLDRIGRLGKDAVAMLTPEPTSGDVWNANRGAITLRVTVRGKSAHVGLQHQGINAFERMLAVAAELQALRAEVERRRTDYRIIPDAAAGSILLLGGRVEGGTNFNVVPDSCRFTLDRRFNPEESIETEKGRLLDLFDGVRRRGIDLEVEVLQEGAASGTPEDHPVAQTLAQAITDVVGARPAFTMCPGLLETRWYAAKGIPAFAYGPGPLELSHGPRESIEIENIFRHTLIYALTAARLLA